MSRPDHVMSLLMTGGLVLSACAATSARSPGGAPLAFAGGPEEVRGRLIEARCFYNTGATGDDHTFCAFMSAKANLPLGVLTADNELILLTTAPEPLAEHVTRIVAIRGTVTGNRQLLRPESLRVRDAGQWNDIALDGE
jgi:hypothetical protein